MKTVESMGMKKSVKKTGTPDITDNNYLITSQTHVLKALVKGMGNTLMGAARAKGRRSFNVQQTSHCL
jgi:hypothetical protein